MKNTRNLNKILVSCVAFLFIAIFSIMIVSADDHTHEFTDGVCSCGDLKIEAESVTPNGTPTGGASSFIGSNANCSGGGLICQWGNGDTNVTYSFSATAGEYMQIGLAISPCSNESGTISGGLIAKINGVDVQWTENVMPNFDGSNWHNYRVVYTTVVEAQENNSFYLEANNGFPLNIDYFIVDFVDAPIEENIPEVTDGAKIEMESVTPNGTPTDLEQGFILERDGSSEGWCIGNWANGDTNVTYKFTVAEATKAKIGIALVTGWGGTNLDVKVNGEKVAFADSFDPFTDWANGWYAFKVYYLEEVQLNAGENEIYIEAYQGSNFNFDYITFDFVYPEVTDGSKIEMESVTPNGTPTDLEQGFILNRDGASEGWCIGNWGNGDTNVTYKFTVAEATKAKIGIALVTGCYGTNLDVKINGEKVAFADSFDPFTDWENGWYAFKVYYLNEVQLNAGENEIYIEAYQGSNFNFDYIIFDFVEDEPVVPPHACESVCPECGKCLDAECAEAACAEKCEGHAVEPEIPAISDGDRIEVETVYPNGTPTDPNDVFVFDKATASGGAVIGNWGMGDNNVTYKFNVAEATKAKIGIALVTGWGAGTNLIVRVNGQDVAFADSFDPFTDWANGWYNFKVYYLNEVQLNAGENTIYLEAYEGHNFNFDYIIFDFVDGDEPVVPPHECESICPECGKCLDAECAEAACAEKCQGHVVEPEIPAISDGDRIEMESVTPNGTPTDLEQGFILNRDGASEGWCIGNWGNGDTNVTYKFTVAEATKAKIGIALVTGWYGTNLDVKVNGEKVAFADSFDPFTDWENGWYAFKVYYLNEVQLNAGENEIYIEAYQGSNFNFDYIIFDFVEDEPVVPPHACESICPECGKCLDAECAEAACAEKCEGHTPAPSVPTINDGDRIEVETVYPNGTPTDVNDVFVFDKDTASGGAVIGNWGRGDNNVTYKFNITEATNAKIGIALVTGWYGTDLIVKVNGIEVAFADAFAPFDGQWYGFKVYYLNEVELHAGENEIYLGGVEGSSFNFDYIVFDFVEDAPVVPPHVCESICPECGKCLDAECEEAACAEKCQGHVVEPEIPAISDGDRIEMESVTPNGTPTDLEQGFILNRDGASEGWCIGNWGNGDTNVTYKFTVAEATKAKIGIALVTGWGGTNLDVKVNGEKVDFADSFDPFTDWENGWYAFKVYYLNEVQLNAGENEIYIEAYQGSNFNFDYIIFDFVDGDEPVVPPHVCESICPECGKCLDAECAEAACAEKCQGHTPVHPDHTHEFVNGSCSCGSIKIEMETVTPNGTSTDLEQGFILNRDGCSEGWCIGNWGHGDTSVSYKFSVSNATTARIGIALVTGWYGTSLDVKVNGQSVSFADSFKPFTDWANGWYNFSVYYLEEVELIAGENELYIGAVEGSNFNFDYFFVEFGDGSGAGTPSHEHNYVDGRCPTCGAFLLEAEDTNWQETITSTDNSGAGIIIEETDLASGNWTVGNWGLAGNKIIWEVDLPIATEGYIVLHIAPCSDAANFSEVMRLTVNGVELQLTNDSIPGLVGDQWYNFQAFDTYSTQVEAGKITIVLEMLTTGYYCNVDCIELIPGKNLGAAASDVVAPTISDIEIDHSNLEAGKDVNFDFSVKDNVTAKDDIAVDVKVYLDYGKDSQTEIECADGSFLPTVPGRYTIVITATDKKGNTSTKTRGVTIYEDDGIDSKPETPVVPDNPDTPDGPETPEAPEDPTEETIWDKIGNWEPVEGWPLKVFAWETAGTAAAIAAAVAFVLYVLKAWVFGRLQLERDERVYARELTKSLKKSSRSERRDVLSEERKRIRKVVKWNLGGRIRWNAVIAVLLLITIVAVPVLTTALPYIKEALFPTNTLTPDSESAKLAIGEAKENVIKIEEEGITLLKNNQHNGKAVLPLDPKNEGDVKVNLFGSSVFGMLYGGGGSGVFVTNANSYGNDLYMTRLEDALETEGFQYNKDLYNLVANYFESKTYKITETDYDIQCQNNVFGGNTKDDKGNILIDETRFPYDNEPEASAYTRTYDGLDGKTLLEAAKEYSDIAIYAVSRAGSEDGDLRYSNTLLTDREEAMIELLKENFERVIILINSSNTMELGVLDDDGIDSVLWIGHPGLTGNTAVAGVISGRVNPSGRMVDTWPYSGKDNPASLMFGHEGTENYANNGVPFQIYYEGVYLGYRYYVTRALTDAGYNYHDHVQYSFGEGMSYTTYEKHITEMIIDPEQDIVSIQVAVTNTGNMAGKEVVQIYFSAPYTGMIEKPYYELAGFAKTDIIEPGETYFARVEFAFSDMSSWYNGANGGKGAYVLEAGEYEISLRENVWDICPDSDTEDEFVNAHVYNLAESVEITTDPITGNTVQTRFSDVEFGPNDNAVTYLSRSDWSGTYPTEDKINTTASSSVAKTSYVKSYKDNLISDKDTGDYVQGANNGLVIRDFKGVALDGSITKNGKKYTWDDLINQMTLNDMFKLVDSRFMGTVAIESVGKPEMGDDDGPASVSIYGVGYPSEVVVASTWNTDMAYLLGYSLGKEGAAMGMTGWYAPGLNLHRAAPGGRNFEYYSEDPLISGLMAAGSVKGAAKFGVYTYIKHFALNDQETDRRTIQVWANEQSMRELYLRAFEIAIKEGGSMGIMSSFNFIGTTWTGGSHALMTEVLRDEWGFEGVAVTDWTNPGTMPVNAGLRAGNDLWLGKNVTYGAAHAYNEAPDDVHFLLRQACKRILYAAANSNAVWTAEEFYEVGITDPPKGNHEALEGYH